MEDSATAEISRAQLWQWVNHAAQVEAADEREVQEVLRRWTGRTGQEQQQRQRHERAINGRVVTLGLLRALVHEFVSGTAPLRSAIAPAFAGSSLGPGASSAAEFAVAGEAVFALVASASPPMFLTTWLYDNRDALAASAAARAKM